MKSQYDKENLWQNKLFFELGGLGVVFFFVLSGFLITFLLLQEKERTGNISIKKFYFRRILRIWPLYFFIMILGFFVLPNFHQFDHPYFTRFFNNNFYLNLVLYFFLLPNLALAFLKPVPHIGQLWSIGVEEQFYLMWPWIVKKSKNLLKVLIAIIILSLFVKGVFHLYTLKNADTSFLKQLKIFLATLKFESMAIGGIGAWCVHNKKYYQILLSNAMLILAFVGITLTIFYTPPVLQDGIFIVQSVLFLIIMLNVSCNSNSFLKLENKAFIFLGNISYGIYMYHFIVIVGVILLFNKLGIPINNDLGNQLLFYTCSIISTLVISWLSYELLEKYFIKLKKNSTVIESGSN